eukprot:gene28317-35077_t
MLRSVAVTLRTRIGAVTSFYIWSSWNCLSRLLQIASNQRAVVEQNGTTTTSCECIDVSYIASATTESTVTVEEFDPPADTTSPRLTLLGDAELAVTTTGTQDVDCDGCSSAGCPLQEVHQCFPGTYSYILRASDGSNNHGYATQQVKVVEAAAVSTKLNVSTGTSDFAAAESQAAALLEEGSGEAAAFKQEGESANIDELSAGVKGLEEKVNRSITEYAVIPEDSNELKAERFTAYAQSADDRLEMALQAVDDSRLEEEEENGEEEEVCGIFSEPEEVQYSFTVAAPPDQADVPQRRQLLRGSWGERAALGGRAERVCDVLEDGNVTCSVNNGQLCTSLTLEDEDEAADAEPPVLTLQSPAMISVPRGQ